jgi:hypothetical protein
MDKKKISDISKNIQTDAIKLNEKMKLLNNIFSLLLSISNKNSKNKIIDEYTIVLKNYKEFINNIMNKLTKIPFYVKYKNIIMELNEKIFTLYKNLKILYIIFKLSYSISNENKKENVKDEYNKTIKDHKLFISDLIKNLDYIKNLFNKEKKKTNKNNIFNEEFYELLGVTKEEFNKYEVENKNSNLNSIIKKFYYFIYTEKIIDIIRKYNLNPELNTKVNFNKVKEELIKNKNKKNIDDNLYNELIKLITVEYYKKKIGKIVLSNINQNKKIIKLKEELNEDKKYINNDLYDELITFINYSIKISLQETNNKFKNNENNGKNQITVSSNGKNQNIIENFDKFTSKSILALNNLKSISNINNINQELNENINLPNYLKNQAKFIEKLNEINKLQNKNKIKNEISNLQKEIYELSKNINNDNFLIFLVKINKLLKNKNITNNINNLK